MTKKKKAWITVGVLLVSIIGFRLYLPILAKNYINEKLNEDPLYEGNVERVKIHLWRGAYTAEDLTIERVDGQKTFPFVSAREIDVGLGWKELIHGSIAARLAIHKFDINFVQKPRKENGDEKNKVAVGASTKSGRKKEAKAWQLIFRDLIPIDIGRLELTEGKIHFRDLTSKPKLDLSIDQINAYGHNLTNSTKASKSLFGTINVHARVMNSGELTLKLYLNPSTSPWELKATTQLSDLDLTELNPFFKAYGSFDVKQGKFSLYSEMATAHNNVEGYFKPLIQNLQVADFEKDKKQGVLHVVWEQIVQAIGGLLKNHPKDRQAAKIPFSGKMDKMNIDTWGTIGSVLQNIFIKPIKPNIENTVQLKDVDKKKNK